LNPIFVRLEEARDRPEAVNKTIEILS